MTSGSFALAKTLAGVTQALGHSANCAAGLNSDQGRPVVITPAKLAKYPGMVESVSIHLRKVP
jgi:hypothetical protein